MSKHNATIRFSSPAEIDYTLDVDYELEADTLVDWTLTHIKAECDDGVKAIYTDADIRSERYYVPQKLYGKYRKEIEALILEASDADASVPRLKWEHRHVN